MNTPDLITEKDNQYLSTKEKYYLNTKRIREKQENYFCRLGVNEYITRLGQEPIAYKSDGWVASVALMEKMGIKNVEASPDYGSTLYVASHALAYALNKGYVTSFDLDASNNILPKNSKKPFP